MSDASTRIREITAAIAERAHLVRVRDGLGKDIAKEDARVQQLAKELQYERADVERLTTGIMGFVDTILSVVGESNLDKEKREAVEAAARLAEAQGVYVSLCGQRAAIEHRIAQLVPAQLDADLAAARSAREQELVGSKSTIGVHLADLAIRVESLDIELVPLADAVVAGEAAFQAVAAILAALDAVGTNPKKLGEKTTAMFAGDAQAKLVGFQRALREVASASFDNPLTVDEDDLAFADAWIKQLFARGTREERLAAARAEMVARIERIATVMAPLRAQRDQLAQRRLALVLEREQLVGPV